MFGLLLRVSLFLCHSFTLLDNKRVRRMLLSTNLVAACSAECVLVPELTREQRSKFRDNASEKTVIASIVVLRGEKSSRFG